MTDAEPGDEPERPDDNPFGALFGPGTPGSPPGQSGTPGPTGPAGMPDLGAALHQLGDLLSGSTGPVNWKLARQAATAVAGAGDAGTTAGDTAAVAEAIRLADHWLDPVTTLASGVTSTEAWSRRRWVEATTPAWTRLVDPVAARVVQAMSGVVPEEMRAAAGPMLGMMSQVGGLMFGAQVGQALGQLAAELVASTDIGLPLGPTGLAALLPANVIGFGGGLGVPPDEVRIFLALREAAHHRLFAHVPWLAGHLFDAVEAYAKGITVDLSALESALRELNPTDPEALQRALTGGMFEPQTTPAQQQALARLETALALVEGWVDAVTAAAASRSLPAADALRETVRRRRASGGPAEATFATLVGLELRPRRLREAAELWHVLADRRGIDGRDALWDHPDLLPTADDLDDPTGFADRAGTDVDWTALTSGGSEAPREPPGDRRGPHEQGPGEGPEGGGPDR